MANVVFDEQSAARIAKAVKYVEGLQSDEPPVEDEEVIEEPRRILRGSFAGTWRSGTSKTVAVVADNGEAGTKTATNYGPDVEGGGCVIVLAGGSWLLVWAGLTERDATATKVQSTAGVEAVTDIAPAGSITYLTSAESTSGITTEVEVVTGLFDTGKEVVTSVEASGSNPYVQTVNSLGSKTFVTDVQLNGSGSVVTGVSASGSVVTGVSCVNGKIVVTTASLSDLLSVTAGPVSGLLTVNTGTVSFSDLAEAQSGFLELGDICKVTTSTLLASDLGGYSRQNISITDAELSISTATLTLADLAEITKSTITLEDLASLDTTEISYYGPN